MHYEIEIGSLEEFYKNSQFEAIVLFNGFKSCEFEGSCSFIYKCRAVPSGKGVWKCSTPRTIFRGSPDFGGNLPYLSDQAKYSCSVKKLTKLPGLQQFSLFSSPTLALTSCRLNSWLQCGGRLKHD